jgi:hypothetical protein
MLEDRKIGSTVRPAADPKPLRESPLVEPYLLRLVADFHCGDRPLQCSKASLRKVVLVSNHGT